MRIKENGKVAPASFLKIEKKGPFVGAEEWRKGGKLVEVGGDQNPIPGAPRRCKGAREEGAKEMLGEERRLEEQWRRVGVSESLRGRRSER